MPTPPTPPARSPRRPPGIRSLPTGPQELANDTPSATVVSPAQIRRDIDAARPSANQARVIKKLSPGQPGSKKLLRRFGDALVCVRYRYDGAQAMRYTTVELVVDEAPTTPQRTRPPPMVHVLVRIDESALRRQIAAHGARWDPVRQAWHMSRKIAKQLRLQDRFLLRDSPLLDMKNGKF
jgi:hypothetical protein